MRLGLRRLASATVASILVGLGFVAVGASPSLADTSTATVSYACQTQAFGVSYLASPQSVPVTLTWPTTSNYNVPIVTTYSIAPADTPKNVGTTLTDATLVPTATVKGTAGSFTTSTSGLGATTGPVTVAPFAHLPLSFPITAAFGPSAFLPGDVVSIRPDVLQITINSVPDGVSNMQVICSPPTSVASVGTTSVTGPAPVDSFCEITTPGGSCATGQNLAATISSGTLTQQVVAEGTNPDATSVVFPAVTSSSTVQTVTAPFNRITVTDTRGGQYPASLTADLATPLSAPGGAQIAKSALVVGSLGCSGVTGSAPATAGAGGDLGTTQLFCQTSSSALNATGTTSGVYQVTGGWTLNVPAFQASSSYNATLIVTLA